MHLRHGPLLLHSAGALPISPCQSKQFHTQLVIFWIISVNMVSPFRYHPLHGPWKNGKQRFGAVATPPL
jgi:hypothetical protein